jgi:hypothetical protein
MAATPTLTLTAEASAKGIADLESQVQTLKHEFLGTATSTSATGGQHDAVKLYNKTPANTRSREALEVLPGGEANAVTPEELATLMKADPKTGKPIKKASARAALRVLMVKADKRIKAGALSDKIVRVNFDDYDTDGAGRYYLDVDARKALDKYLASAGT